MANLVNLDVWTLTQTLAGETRGETIEGKVAVAHVIRNRAIDKRWPDTIHEVCKQPWQFSCWNPKDPNCKMIDALEVNDLARYAWLRECFAVALGVASGIIPDPTGGANHYFNPKVVNPDWAKGKPTIYKEGNHVFLKL